MYAEHFQPEKILAAGPSAKVYRGVETATGRKVLMKALQADEETQHPLDRERLQQLAPALMQMRHPQIAGLITLLPTEDEFALVSEFMPGMNARTFAASRSPAAPADLRALAVQLMHALLVGEHLRQPHGDPKPSNLIIADHPGGGLFLQVQDWGLSLARSEHPPETLWFRAPELLQAGGQATSQSDLFTAAGSLFCIATNTAPTQGTTVAEVMADWQGFNAGHVLGHLRPDLDPPLRDWLAWLLNLAPQMRPHSVAQALDILMLSMQTGFMYMPQQAPVMAPGAQTTPLISAKPPPAPTHKATPPQPAPAAAPKVAAAATPAAAARPAHAAAPESAPAGPATTTDASKPAAANATAPKKSSAARVAAAVILNLAALVLIGLFVWPVIFESTPSKATPAAAVSSEKASAAVPAKKMKKSTAAPAAQAALPEATAATAPGQ